MTLYHACMYMYMYLVFAPFLSFVNEILYHIHFYPQFVRVVFRLWLGELVKRGCFSELNKIRHTLECQVNDDLYCNGLHVAWCSLVSYPTHCFSTLYTEKKMTTGLSMNLVRLKP